MNNPPCAAEARRPSDRRRLSAGCFARNRPIAVLSFAVAAIMAGCGVSLDGGGATTDRRPAGSDSASDRLIQPPQPPTLVARDAAQARDVGGSASPDRLAQLAARNGAVRFEGAQLPFFFESELGQAYLRAGPGRAIAQGAPRESCPGFGVALSAPAVESAVESALGRCLDDLALWSAPETCGCRVLAADAVLLDETDAFAYARATHVRLIDQARGLETSLIAEERAPRPPSDDPSAAAARIEALSHGARSIWLLAPTGPFAALELKADGVAEMAIVKGPASSLDVVRRLDGRWRAEGFRRGRLAKTVALSDDAGSEITLLIGYEPDELEARGAALAADADSLRGPSEAERAAQ